MRAALLALTLLVPLPLVAVAGIELADHAGRELARSAAEVTRQLQSKKQPEPPLAVLVPELGTPTELDTDASTKRVPRRRTAAARAETRAGLYVRADAVLRLANRGSRPSGAFVPAAGERPAGIALAGVSGLGIGLSDGDILTHAAGLPARSAGQVVGLVIASRAARAPQISGRIWRSGRYLDVVVEQPYVLGLAKRRAGDG